jgi:hypothetical protein
MYAWLCVRAACDVQVVRRKKRSLLTKYLFPVLEGVGHAVGVATFVCALCLYGFGVVLMMGLSQHSRGVFLLSYTANWLVTNFVTYVVWDFCVYFNPFLCCAPSPPLAGAPKGGEGSGTATRGHQRPPRRTRLRVLMSSAMSVAGRCLRWLGLAQWQVERLRARDRLRLILLPDSPRAQRLSRVLSKPKLSVEIKKFQ